MNAKKREKLGTEQKYCRANESSTKPSLSPPHEEISRERLVCMKEHQANTKNNLSCCEL